MIVDSSAALAVLFDEADSASYELALAEASVCRMSAANYVEAAIVLESRLGFAAGPELDRLIAVAEIQVVPVTAEQALAAREAWRRFGKGNHPAGLNYGDCFAYALAAIAGEPLLYKGMDFALTDVESAL